jgi:branched-chain amino acid transport system ATP-binding protein
MPISGDHVSAPTPVLRVAGLKAGYGGRLIVDGVDLDLAEREIATVIGHNGAGKSTVLKGIFNMLPVKQGRVELQGRDITKLPPHRMLTAGIAYVPQNHSVFPKLTIGENLAMGGYLIDDKAVMAERLNTVREMFPFLVERKQQLAGTLSGGEQRILEIARTLLVDPAVIMLDEPSIGLAPKMVEMVFETVHRLRDAGKSFLMVEQNVRRALEASDRGYVLELGQIRIQDAASALIGDDRVVGLYMGRGGRR